ncbi:hypothetical protein CEK25_003657 [Fusarium fujikuroi]|nr:hypothetical protein CEK25_003657 [Fusarium fujikuroi]
MCYACAATLPLSFTFRRNPSAPYSVPDERFVSVDRSINDILSMVEEQRQQTVWPGHQVRDRMRKRKDGEIGEFIGEFPIQLPFLVGSLFNNCYMTHNPSRLGRLAWYCPVCCVCGFNRARFEPQNNKMRGRRCKVKCSNDLTDQPVGVERQ